MKELILNKKDMLEAKLRYVVSGAKDKLKELLLDEAGMGTVEVILIIVVLIGLVIIFKKEIDGLVTEIFKTINSDAAKVTG
ncbi:MULTISPECIES: Flp1 family type IVb pilin [unclassified Butyrivibrio]|uniref:Flp1 family type IVb pilin n=1 Tax=unclassified Butyrivibrio TaxID=2639466 RepID=UPI0003B315E7|nr:MULTISPECIES: Flp1 family type IVb pilin [unclassified Butyrivibrio]SDB54737.1 Putative Flagellin, Flp1-like, domain [Butyrivibrio sp. INlla16]